MRLLSCLAIGRTKLVALGITRDIDGPNQGLVSPSIGLINSSLRDVVGHHV